MTTKLTLTLDKQVINRAKEYAKKQGTSLSKLVESYFTRIYNQESGEINNVSIPPITKELTGIISSVKSKSNKDLLKDALEDRFL